MNVRAAVKIYIILLLASLSYSCGGWDKSCGLCWVGVVQAPLILVDELIDMIKKIKNKKGG
jgi:hypothetical protein